MASQDCQWEKNPDVMAKLRVKFISAVTRQTAKAAAVTAAGFSSAAATDASRLFLRRPFPTLAPFPKRILMIMGALFLQCSIRHGTRWLRDLSLNLQAVAKLMASG